MTAWQGLLRLFAANTEPAEGCALFVKRLSDELTAFHDEAHLVYRDYADKRPEALHRIDAVTLAVQLIKDITHDAPVTETHILQITKSFHAKYQAFQLQGDDPANLARLVLFDRLNKVIRDFLELDAKQGDA